MLASKSPRRQELLRLMGFAFEVMESGVDESAIQADHPRTFALRAAFAKAREVARRAPEPALVIAADTVVSLEMRLFGKPRSAEEARSMLRSLSGRTHIVTTAVAIAEAGRPSVLLDSEETRVHFRPLDEQTINSYIKTGEPFDKAGAYGIQGHGGALVDSIEGDYYNVVGFPCELFVKMLGQFIDTRGHKAPPVRWKPSVNGNSE